MRTGEYRIHLRRTCGRPSRAGGCTTSTIRARPLRFVKLTTCATTWSSNRMQATSARFCDAWRERYPDRHRQIVETVRLAAPFFGGFVYRKEIGDSIELEWFHADDPDTVLGPRQLSDGTLRFICLTTLLLQPVELQPELILVDEPELGLHPSALALLAEMLQHAGDSRQVVASTQSADLVSEFEPEDVVVVDRREGASTFTRLDRDDLREWLEEYALGELWKMNIFGGRPGR